MRLVRWHSLVLPGGGPMRRLNIAAFMQLGAAIHTLTEVKLGKPLSDDVLKAAYDARELIESLLREDEVPLHIPATRNDGRELLATIVEIVTTLGAVDASTKINWSYKLYLQATKFRTVIQSEIAVQAVYYLWPKRAYDVNVLADRAVLIFSPDLRQWFTSSELADIDQAGKCLAFEVGTAACFHMLRAAESVIRRYLELVAGELPPPKMRSWGVYVRILKSHGGDEKVIGAISQVKEFHRNPVVHPEDQMTIEESLSLLGIIESLIGAIYRDMSKRTASGAAACWRA